MIVLGILLSIAAIGFFCWLLFTLAVFALPFFAGVSAGTWTYHASAGWQGAILVGMVAGGLTLGIGQILLAIVRPLWAKLTIVAVFVMPAVIGGYQAVHGIVKHTPCRPQPGRLSSQLSGQSRSAPRLSCASRA